MVKARATGIVAAMAVLLTAFPANAEPVQLSYKGISLNGELTVSEGATLGNGVVLITHGSLAHHDMEIVVAIREALLERDIASLAISLGFNIDDRKGFYDCAPDRHFRGRTDRSRDTRDAVAGAWFVR
jgi:hypothetical protein